MNNYSQTLEMIQSAMRTVVKQKRYKHPVNGIKIEKGENDNIKSISYYYDGDKYLSLYKYEFSQNLKILEKTFTDIRVNRMQRKRNAQLPLLTGIKINLSNNLLLITKEDYLYNYKEI